jgi:hypothetical protein
MTSRPPQLAPKVERSGNVTVITFTGRSSHRMGNMLANELEGHTDGLSKCHLLLDFINVESLGSFEIGSLITLHKKMARILPGCRLEGDNMAKEEVNSIRFPSTRTLLEVACSTT